MAAEGNIVRLDDWRKRRAQETAGQIGAVPTVSQPSTIPATFTITHSSTGAWQWPSYAHPR